MLFTPREVLIPLVDARGGGALCRVTADGNLPPQHPAHLDRSISELLECGLYQAGQQAQAAVRHLRLGSSFLRRPAPAALSVVNPGDVVGLAPDNSASAELGLALAKLLYLTQSSTLSVLATGKLEADTAQPNVRVRPIHHLADKFSLVRHYFKQSGAPAPPKLFFVPELDVDGILVGERYADAIAGLQSMDIAVIPVSNLRAAADKAKAVQLPERAYASWIRRGVAAAGVLAALIGTIAWMVARPISLEFVPRALDGGRIVQTPVRLSEAGGGKGFSFLPCAEANGLPVFRSGDALAASVKSSDFDDWMSHFARHYYMLVAVSPVSGAKVLPLPKPIDEAGLRAGELVNFKLDVLVGPDEDNLLVMLAQRLRPIDAAHLSTELHRQLDRLLPTERLSAARNLLRGMAPGVLEYMFRTVKNNEACL